MYKVLCILLLSSLLLVGCSRPEAAGVTKTNGEIFIKRSGSREFSRIYSLQAIKLDEPVQSRDETSYAELGFGFSRFILMPNSQITFKKVKTSEQGDLWMTLQLDYGSVYVESGHSLGKGSLEVHTTNGVAALQGSSMLVTQDTSTTVFCLSGSATLSGSSTVQLAAGQTSSLLAPGTAPAPPDNSPLDYIYSDNPIVQDMIKFTVWDWEGKGPTPTSSLLTTITSTIPPTVTRTPWLTQTPAPLFPTSTQRVDGAVPTYRPTITLPAGFSGLTPEEQSARGSHTYQVTCQSWGNCVCDSALAEPLVNLPIEFSDSQVTLGAGEQVFSYTKLWPNLYQVRLEQKVAEIRFIPEGFEFFVTQTGHACSLQIFTRQP